MAPVAKLLHAVSREFIGIGSADEFIEIKAQDSYQALGIAI